MTMQENRTNCLAPSISNPGETKIFWEPWRHLQVVSEGHLWVAGCDKPQVSDQWKPSAVPWQTLQLHCWQPTAKSKMWAGRIPPQCDELSTVLEMELLFSFQQCKHDENRAQGLCYQCSTLSSFSQQEIQLFSLIFTLHTCSYWAKWTLTNAHRQSGKAQGAQSRVQLASTPKLRPSSCWWTPLTDCYSQFLFRQHRAFPREMTLTNKK